MIQIDKKYNCSGCYACFNICPKDAIVMTEDENGFKYPIVNKKKCINCGLCKKVCPIISETKIENKPIAYAAYNKDEEIRKNSSSGGIFSLLAEYILENDGVIFGAAFDEKFMVKHIAIKNKNELYKLRTSKYLQSLINNTYKQAREYLNNNKMVLFTGTPCQIEGLYSFLGKDYEKLYTQDIICHGVPSPKVWKKYLEFREKNDLKKTIEINFRNKDKGWSGYEVLLKYKDSNYRMNHNNDIFMKVFLNDLCLRDSCYNCSFKKKNRISSVTLADFWGIDNVVENMNDDKGTSLLIVNNEKGKRLFENIKDNIEYKEVDFEESIKYNPSMNNSVKMPKERNKFFENLDKMSFDKLVKKYTPKRNVIRRVGSKMKKIIKNNLILK